MECGGLTEWNPPENKNAVQLFSTSSGSSKSKAISSRRRTKLLEGIQEDVPRD